ncbi:MAG: signal peptidase I [Firmicutes bacterium]|nr:signal peptidase I [Bacillota bacterium]
MSEDLKEWIKDIGVALVVGLLLIQFIKPTIVKEHSMEPTLQENNYIFLSRQAYTLFGEPERGDIVVFHTDLRTVDGKEKSLVKRIIGLPGETVSITGGVVYINGEPLEEDYTLDGYTNTELEEVVVPEGELFCMGDNRQNSIDSRDSSVGCVPIDQIIGKAVLRLYPFNEITLF